MRHDGRQPDQLRPLTFQRRYTGSAPGSVLARLGRTTVLCTCCVTLEVPPFLVGTGKGWLNTGGSHGLQQFMNEVAKDIADPRTGKPVFEEARKHAIQGEAEADRKAAEADPSLRLSPTTEWYIR